MHVVHAVHAVLCTLCAGDLLRNGEINMMIITTTGDEADVRDGKDLRRYCSCTVLVLLTGVLIYWCWSMQFACPHEWAGGWGGGGGVLVGRVSLGQCAGEWA